MNAKDLYKEYEYNCDYNPILKSIGNVVIQVDDDDYQGDSRVLYNNDGKIGYLNFGWGSCSGCDALQGCDNWEELQELCDDLEQQTKWWESKEEALEWFTTHDWEGDYSWHYDGQREFIAKAMEYLKS